MENSLPGLRGVTAQQPENAELKRREQNRERLRDDSISFASNHQRDAWRILRDRLRNQNVSQTFDGIEVNAIAIMNYTADLAHLLQSDKEHSGGPLTIDILNNAINELKEYERYRNTIGQPEIIDALGCLISVCSYSEELKQLLGGTLLENKTEPVSQKRRVVDLLNILQTTRTND